MGEGGKITHTEQSDAAVKTPKSRASVQQPPATINDQRSRTV